MSFVSKNVHVSMDPRQHGKYAKNTLDLHEELEWSGCC